ncbi:MULTISPECIES: copper homeostasis membrane protein CopD [unclassified Bradyrhizobium]|uniref:copper homeostasis membrane protein CopD n=1 Tax=unclassified Bradyrhizobium TaxID=2631580 RepID=UPI001FF8535B|nr:MULTISPECIES: copper homeostasis membrane protein CopD [unclassified Bradyrhizobium]
MLGDAVNVSLIVVRAIHFAATAITVGVLIFRAVMAQPAPHLTGAARILVMEQMIVRAAWIGVAVTVASGAAWVLLEAAAMSGLPLGEAATTDILSTVLAETQFGMVSEIRVALAIVLAACLSYDRLPLAQPLALASSLGLIAGIAWTGHAGSSAGDIGSIHVMADALHLIAAAAWLGGLVPFTLLLAEVRRNQDHASAFVSQAARRFSSLGMLSVGTILATGIVNAWILVGSIKGLLTTEYGWLLIVKIFLFMIMLAFAAINRYWLTPDLALPLGNEAQLKAVRRLTRNSGIEIAFGLAIFAVVGVLGTLHPAVHLAN